MPGSPRPSRQPALWSLSVALEPEGEDAVAELLLRLSGESAIISHSRLTGRSTVSVYLAQPRFWNVARRRALDEGLAQIRACGLHLGRIRVRWARVQPEDWSESWKRHFRPLVVGRSLLVRPSWSRRRPMPGQAELVLDPGLSFGTGQHPTTDFCLREVVRLRPRGTPASCLDVGTGSGILALAAARLGYAPVTGCDADPEAIVVARRNAADNGLDQAVHLTRGDVARLPIRPTRPHEVVCANLTADLLQQHATRLWAQVRPGGRLVLAGILTEEFDRLRRQYEALGGTLERHRSRGEWTSGTFHRAKEASRPPGTSCQTAASCSRAPASRLTGIRPPKS